MSKKTLFWLLYFNSRQKLLPLPVPTLYEKIFPKFLKGLSQKELTDLANAFLDQSFSEHLYSPTIEVLEKAKQNGHHTAILSSSPDFLVSAIGERLGVHQSFGTRYHTDSNGLLSAVDTVMDAHEKVRTLEALQKELQLPPQDCIAYSDSISDLPFLEAAGEKVAVQPDFHLKKIARSQDWQIL